MADKPVTLDLEGLRRFTALRDNLEALRRKKRPSKRDRAALERAIGYMELWQGETGLEFYSRAQLYPAQVEEAQP